MGRAFDARGSRRHGLGSSTEPRRPRPAGRFPSPLQHARADLPSEMRPAWGPAPLWLLAEARADHLLDRGGHKAHTDPFAMPVALAISGNEALVMRDRGLELRHGCAALPGRSLAAGGHRGVEGHLDGRHDLYGLGDVARPHGPWASCSCPDDRITQRRVHRLLPGLVRHACRRLLQHGEPHRPRAPSEAGLGVGMAIQLELAPRVPAIRHAGERLMALVTWRLAHCQEPPCRLLVRGLDAGQACAGDGNVLDLLTRLLDWSRKFITIHE
jgi:hypothetical protein